MSRASSLHEGCPPVRRYAPDVSILFVPHRGVVFLGARPHKAAGQEGPCVDDLVGVALQPTDDADESVVLNHLLVVQCLIFAGEPRLRDLLRELRELVVLQGWSGRRRVLLLRLLRDERALGLLLCNQHACADKRHEDRWRRRRIQAASIREPGQKRLHIRLYAPSRKHKYNALLHMARRSKDPG